MIDFDSKEEEYFYWYILELKNLGFVDDWKYQPKTFELFDKCNFSFVKKMKTKNKICENILLRKHLYTPDFGIKWNDSVRSVLFELIGTTFENKDIRRKRADIKNRMNEKGGL